MSQDPSEYVLYLRKSKGRAGIARQRTTTTAHIERLGGRIIGEYTDTDSTAYARPGEAPPPRKAFARLLADLPGMPGVGIAAWHADRILRNPEETEQLIRVCATGGHPIETRSGGSYNLAAANGRKRLRDDANDAAYEVDHNRERVLEKKAEAAAEGRWLGGRRPFGYRPDRDAPGGLVLDDREATALAQAHRDVLDGMSLHSIARGWNASGLPTSTGARWTATEVKRVLVRPMNAAPPPAKWPAITDTDTCRAVSAILSRPDRKLSPGPERRHLLSGLALCGICGAPVWATSTAKNKRKRVVYRCSGNMNSHVARDEAALDDAITRLVIARLSQPDAASLLLRRDTADGLAALRRRHTAIEAAMTESNELRRRKLLTMEEFAAERAEHQAELAGIEEKIAAAQQANILAPMLADPAAAWERLDLDRRRAVIAMLMTITIMPARKGRPEGWRPGGSYFDPDTILITPKHPVRGPQ